MLGLVKSQQPPRSRRVVVLGAGFGGAYCARRLSRKRAGASAEVVLIDRRNYFVFYPLLVEAATASLTPRHAVVSIRSFVDDAEFLMAEVTAVDPGRNQVEYFQPVIGRHGSIGYDNLVIALGTVTNLPNVPGLHEHGYEMKSLQDAVRLRDRAIELLELANATADPDMRRELLHLVVVGGNFTGVEVAGEFMRFLRVSSKNYRNLRHGNISVSLVEIADRILNVMDPDLSRYAARQLARAGVQLRLQSSVTEVTANSVRLKSGEMLPTRTVIWCAGIAPTPLLSRLPFPTDERGYLLTGRDLRVPGHENVWAIGDCAVNTGPDGRPYPATAQHAVRQARHAAEDIIRLTRGLNTRPCDIASPGAMASIGCRTGVAKIFGVKISGFAAWWLYRTFYLLKMPGIARKLRVALDWTMDLLLPHEPVQLDVGRRGERQPVALDPARSLGR